MADFGPTEQEIKNVVNPEENYFVLIDGTNPTHKAVVDSTGALKVTGAGGGEQYPTGQADTGVEKGNIALGSDGSNFYYLLTNNLGRLQVDVIGGGGTSGQLVQDGDAVQAGDVGRIIVGTDGSNYQHIAVDSAGQLQIDVLSSALPTGASTLAEQQTQTTALQAIQTAVEILDDWDQNDRAKVSPIPGQNGISAGSGVIDALTPRLTLATDDPAVVSLSILDDWDETDRAKVNPVVGQAGLAAGTGIDVANALRVSLATDVPLPVGTNILGKIGLVDPAGDPLAKQEGASVVGTPYGIPMVGTDDSTEYHIITVTEDIQDFKHRLAIEGKVSVSAPTAPPAATSVSIPADTPLDVSNTETTEWTIPNGVTFTLSQITYGAEGDPNEKGSKITVYYVDSGGTPHVIDRAYFTGFSGQIFPDTSEARDGTSMTGNGTSTLIRIVRERLGGATLEIDCVARGYYA